MLTLYGQVMSRAQRTLWLLEELEVPFEHVKTNQNAGETRTEEFLAINPNGHVPVITDGDMVLWETVAINWHIASKHGAGSLWPSDHNEQSLVMQWSLWMSTELEELMVDYLRHAVIYPEEKRNPALVEAALENYPHRVKVLEAHLQDRDYLVGDSFTLADLNVASMMGLVDVYKQFDNSQFPKTVAWLEKVLARPARAKALART
jgi:glutathione S-transferase